jgi:protein-S-isoprenylcysteine O-methyltransferase Ste14
MDMATHRLTPEIKSKIISWIRTALEDGTLQNELNGYLEYAKQVSYRLFPGIW